MKTGKIFESNVTDGVGDYKFTEIPEGNYKLKILVKGIVWNEAFICTPAGK